MSYLMGRCALVFLCASAALGACSAGGPEASNPATPSSTAGRASSAAGAGGGITAPGTSLPSPATSTLPATSMTMTTAMPAGAKPAVTAGSGAPPVAPTQPVGPAMMAATAGAAAPGTAGAGQPQAAPGPDDGDPSKPLVMLPEVACKQAGGRGFGAGANFKVDDRDVIIDYPCGKHEGAPMTFILNLHGTTPVAQHFYQEGYFSAFKYVGSHNLIIATPSSVVEQWGNGDDGKDLPYLMNVIDWVYKTLGTKFDIRSMWVGGHSWGAFYTSTFGCKPELADKVDGLIIMSGSPSLPACASKMSIIDTNAEMDIAAPLEQGNLPMQHGCKAPQMNMLGNNTQTLWADCMPHYVHSNYLMLGKMHIDSMDDEVVKSIVDLIKQARP